MTLEFGEQLQKLTPATLTAKNLAEHEKVTGGPASKSRQSSDKDSTRASSGSVNGSGSSASKVSAAKSSITDLSMRNLTRLEKEVIKADEASRREGEHLTKTLASALAAEQKRQIQRGVPKDFRTISVSQPDSDGFRATLHVDQLQRQDRNGGGRGGR